MSIPSLQLSTRRALLQTLGALPGAYAWAHWGTRPGLEAWPPTSPPAGATVIALDLSRSMGLEDCLEPAKALAMAFVQWLTAQHPPQAVFILGFEDAAYPIAPTDLPTASWRSRSPGTNIQHALQLARQLLRPYARGDRQVLLLTDGEPTAHCEDDGHIFFGYPPTWTTIERTLEAAAACAQEGICVYPFLVHTADPWSTRFVIELAAAAHERWFAVAKQQPVAVTLAAYRAAVDTHARA